MATAPAVIVYAERTGWAKWPRLHWSARVELGELAAFLTDEDGIFGVAEENPACVVFVTGMGRRLTLWYGDEDEGPEWEAESEAQPGAVWVGERGDTVKLRRKPDPPWSLLATPYVPAGSWWAAVGGSRYDGEGAAGGFTVVMGEVDLSPQMSELPRGNTPLFD